MLVLFAVPCWATSQSHCPALLGSRRVRLEFIAHCAKSACLAALSVQNVIAIDILCLTRHSEDCYSWQSMVLSTFLEL